MEQKTSEFDKVLGAWDILVIAFGASQSGPNWEARSAAICFNTVSRPI